MDTVFAVYLFRIVCLSHVPVWQYAAPGHGTRLTGTAGHIVYISGHRVGSDIQRCCQFAKEQLPGCLSFPHSLPFPCPGLAVCCTGTWNALNRHSRSHCVYKRAPCRVRYPALLPIRQRAASGLFSHHLFRGCSKRFPCFCGIAPSAGFP